MPDLFLDVTGDIGRKPSLYVNRVALEDAKARSDELLEAEIPVSPLISTLVSWTY